MKKPPSGLLTRIPVAVVFIGLLMTGARPGLTADMNAQEQPVFAGQAFYSERPEPETTWTGRIVYRAVVESPNTRRFPYRLKAAEFNHPIYSTPAVDEILMRLVDKQVRAVGRLIDQTGEGGEHELWLATIKPVNP